MDVVDTRSLVMAAIQSIAPDADLRRIQPGRPLHEQVDLDSMDWLNVAAALQEKLSIEIPEEEVGPRATVESILAYIASRRGERQAATGTETGPRRTTHEINGTAVTVRPIRAEDEELEADFVRRLSDDSRYRRFMLTLRELSPAKLEYLTHVDQVGHVALIATVEKDGRTLSVGVARYVVDASGRGCEFSIAIDDGWQRTGLAGVLMQELMEVARARGIASMDGIVLAANAEMLHFARQLGFQIEHDPEDRTVVRIVRAL